MDVSLISAAATALGVAKDLGKAAIGVRDFNQMATTVAQMNEQLLKAQDALFGHMVDMSKLQQEHAEALDELRAIKKLLAERGRYALFEISEGVFVLRVKPGEHIGHDGNPLPAEPDHYVCQRCFDKGIKSILVRTESSLDVCHVCHECNVEYREFRKPPSDFRESKRTWIA